MAGATIQIDESQMADIRDMMSGIKNGAEKAMRMSLNRTLTGVVTLTAQELVNIVTLKSAFIKSQFITRKATTSKLSASLRIPFKPVKYINYQNSASAKGGVLVKVFKDQPSIRFKHVFYATMPLPTGSTSEAHYGIFTRKINAANYRKEKRDNKWGITWLPIDEMVGPGLGAIYENTPGISEKLEQTYAERLLRELDRNVQYLIDQQADKITDV